MRSIFIKRNVKIIFIILAFIFISANLCHSFAIKDTDSLSLNLILKDKVDWSYTIGRDLDATLTLYQGSIGIKDASFPESYVEPKFGKVAHQAASFASAAPEPATMLLLGSGLVILAALGRKKIKK